MRQYFKPLSGLSLLLRSGQSEAAAANEWQSTAAGGAAVAALAAIATDSSEGEVRARLRGSRLGRLVSGTHTQN